MQCQVKTKEGHECDKPVYYILSNGAHSCKLHARHDVTKEIILIKEEEKKRDYKSHKESIRLHARENIINERVGDIILTKMKHFEKTPLTDGYLNIFLDDTKRNRKMGIKFPDLALVQPNEDSKKDQCTKYAERVKELKSFQTLNGFTKKGINIQILSYKISDSSLEKMYTEAEEPFPAEAILFAILTGKEDLWK